MSARSAAYQVLITGHPITQGYVVNDVKFDTYADGVLLDAKGYYKQFISDGEWKPFFAGEKGFIDQALRQTRAAPDNGFTRIQVSVVPPK